jgi:hypothetical protein
MQMASPGWPRKVTMFSEGNDRAQQWQGDHPLVLRLTCVTAGAPSGGLCSALGAGSWMA